MSLTTRKRRHKRGEKVRSQATAKIQAAGSRPADTEARRVRSTEHASRTRAGFPFSGIGKP